jgi:L-ascorbate metabolism protein UlaG (beta-lactamase superfamily)
MNKGGTLDLGYLRATMTTAHHSSSGPGNVYLGDAAGFVIEADGKRVYLAGDTCVFGDMRLIAEIHGPIDVAALPIGDHFTMGVKEAAYACRLIRPKTVVPIHWGTFGLLTGKPEELAAAITDLPGTRIAQLSPGGVLAI